MFGRLAGGLLLRTLDRAQRIDMAMRARGFDGAVRFLGELHMTRGDYLFMGGWSAAFVLFRFVNVPLLLGGLVAGGLP